VRHTALLLLFVTASLAGALPTGSWRITRFFFLEINSVNREVASHEVDPAVNQFLVLTGRELQLTPMSPVKLPYVVQSQRSFSFRIGTVLYRAVLLDDMLWVQVLGAGQTRDASGSGYWVFYLEPYS